MNDSNPTGLDFLKALWRWFKRNFGNIFIFLIFLELWSVILLMDNIYSIRWDVSDIRTDVQFIRFSK